MATCPRCKGHLTDLHQCPRRPAAAALEILACALVGGFAGLLLVARFDPRGQFTEIDSLSLVAGALIGIGIDRTLRR